MKTSAVLTLLLLFFAPFAIASVSPCLRIGLLGEFKRTTGSFSQPFGNEIKSGAALGQNWLTRTNSNACINFELIDIDNSIANIDGYIRKAAKQGIHYFIGLGTSDQSLAARKALAETNSILITPTASAVALAMQPSRTIMLFPTNDLIAEQIAKELRQRGVADILSIYAANSKYSVDMNHSFKKAFEKRGGHIDELPIRGGRPDLSLLISKLKSSNFKYVFVPLFELDAATVISELSRNDLHPFFVGTDAWGTQSSVIRTLVKSRKQKAMIPVIYDAKSTNSVNRQFISEYKKIFRKTPTDLAAFSFDAVTVAYRLNKACGIHIDTMKIPSCLNEILPLNTTTGEIRSLHSLSLKRSIGIQDIDLEVKK